jgi:hypothetical protein
MKGSDVLRKPIAEPIKAANARKAHADLAPFDSNHCPDGHAGD